MNTKEIINNIGVSFIGVIILLVAYGAFMICKLLLANPCDTFFYAAAWLVAGIIVIKGTIIGTVLLIGGLWDATLEAFNKNNK